MNNAKTEELTQEQLAQYEAIVAFSRESNRVVKKAEKKVVKKVAFWVLSRKERPMPKPCLLPACLPKQLLLHWG